MGAYLSHPNLEKVSENGENDRLKYGASAMQGWRLAQEVQNRLGQGCDRVDGY